MHRALVATIGVIVGLALGSAVTYAVISTREPAAVPAPSVQPAVNPPLAQSLPPAPTPTPSRPVRPVPPPAPKSDLPPLPAGINPGGSFRVSFDKFDRKSMAAYEIDRTTSLVVSWPGDPTEFYQSSTAAVKLIFDRRGDEDDVLVLLLDDTHFIRLSSHTGQVYGLDYPNLAKMIDAKKIEFKIGDRTGEIGGKHRAALEDALTFLKKPRE